MLVNAFKAPGMDPFLYLHLDFDEKIENGIFRDKSKYSRKIDIDNSYIVAIGTGEAGPELCDFGYRYECATNLDRNILNVYPDSIYLDLSTKTYTQLEGASRNYPEMVSH